jgi:hypothetical protein
MTSTPGILAAALLSGALVSSRCLADEALVVETTCVSGKVSVDHKDAGDTPSTLPVGAGPHHVKVAFANGDAIERLVFVNAGERHLLRLAPPDSQCAGAHRQGLHFGGSLGFSFGGLAGGALWVGPRAAFLVSYGARPSVDLRSGLALSQGSMALGCAPSNGCSSSPSTQMLGFEVPLRVRFNLGSRYTMGAGADVLVYTDLKAAAFAAGPWVQLVGFRFGERRQWELDVIDFGAYFSPHMTLWGWGGAVNPVIRSSLTLTFLFLPDAPKKP